MRQAALRRAALLVSLCVASSSCNTTRADERGTSAVRIGVPADVLQASQGSVGLTYHRNALTRELLLTMSADGQPTPKAIESWDRSEDGLTWRLKIREGVHFHDGTILDAKALAPHISRELKALSLGEVHEVVAESQWVVRIELARPYAFLFEELSVISAQRSVDGKLIDTGPYVVADESPDRLVLRAAEDYYRGQPSIDRVEVRLFPDQRNAWSALMRDEIDVLYEVSPDALQFVRSESSVTVTTFPRQYVYLFGFNLAQPSLRDARVRRALDMAVDREALVEVAMAGEGEPAQGHVWPRHWAYDAAAGAISYDPGEAIRLFEQAGLVVKERPGLMPSRLRLHTLVYEPLKEMALVLQRQLAEVDVELELEVLSTGQLITRLTNGNFESFIFEMTATRGLKFPYQFWHSARPLLKHGYDGSDDVLDRIRHAANDAEFKAAAAEFQRRVHEDPPAIFLAWGRTSRAVSNRFEIPEGDDDIYHTIARWKPAAKAAN